MLCMSTVIIASCGGTDPGATVQPSGSKDDEKVLNLYIWSDYLTPDTISSFEKLTGIKVRVSYGLHFWRSTLNGGRFEPGGRADA
jgi:spermidine/putrescine-binding protein